MPLYLTEQDVTDLLTMPDALAAVESAFRSQLSGEATNEPRRRVRARGATLHVMSGAVGGLLGFKAYTVAGGKARFHVSLYDATTGELLALIEADRLGQMRTGAASGVATKYLAAGDARLVGLYGAGWQARTQLEAVAAVRPVDAVAVYSRSTERRERFCEEMGARLGIAGMRPVGRPEEAADGADVVITITSAREPVLRGAWLKPGAHVNAAGGNSLLRRELDDDVVRRASFVAVDDRGQARVEAGELFAAVEKGLLTWEQVHELRYVVGGAVRGRTEASEITLFKSLGVAIEDVAAAAVVYRRARERGAGKEI
ncbi:MAG TPA: ornithine cyclodeaminase family protein [Blastocatellia bacterium]|nr:ornithine cyclodeaminase family protein [Blastocatellia bacterium]